MFDALLKCYLYSVKKKSQAGFQCTMIIFMSFVSEFIFLNMFEIMASDEHQSFPHLWERSLVIGCLWVEQYFLLQLHGWIIPARHQVSN